MMRLYTMLGLTLPAVYVSATAPQDLSTHLFECQANGGLGNAVDFSTLWKRQRWENADGALLCSKDIPCSDDSCCGSKGTCGYGPEFCGKGNCTSNCEAMAMCGKYGDHTLNKGRCGMGLCCGASGWCGSDYGPCEKKTPRKCGKGTGSSNGRTIGYYQGSNTYSKLCQKVSPADIDASKYTHLYYAFASINPDTFHVEPANEKDVLVYKEFTALKSKGVETWIAVGGFDFSNEGSTHTTWSDLVASADHRRAFIQSLEEFMAKYGFQGVDIDWEYPVDKKRGGTNADTENLVELVKEMHAQFVGRYKISMALAPDYWYLRYFDAPAMQPYVDWFGFMTYDLHGFWDGENANLGTIVRGQSQIDEIQNNTAPLYFADLDFSKINFGLANYGRGYTLASPFSCTDLGCPFAGPSKPALCTNEKGVMSLTEIKSLIASKKLTPKLLGPQMMKSIQWADQWIGYDDEETFAMKKAWANDYCFGGTMAWSVDYVAAAGASTDVKVTTDGTCGRDSMMRCGTGANKCCSVGGWCGDSEAHCGSGCQSLFGECISGGNTTDGTCGIQNNDHECGRFSNGPCCSAQGYCGFSAAHCKISGKDGLDGCQSGCSSWNKQKGVDDDDKTFGPVGPDSKCNDLKGPRGFTKNIFGKSGAKDEFKKWFNTEENGGRWLSELGRPLGLQRSLESCTIENPCKQPNCADMDHDGDIVGSGWRYLFIISAVNLNNFLANMYKSVEKAITLFSLQDDSLTNDFFWSPEDSVLLSTFGLTGFAAGLSALFSLGNPAAAATGASLAGLVNEGIVALQNQPKVTFQDKKMIFQEIAKSFYKGATTAMSNTNIALVENDGIFTPEGGQRSNALDWLGNGDWVTDETIPLVRNSKDKSVPKGGELMYSFVGASIVNFAWHEQGVYIACYTMSESDFKGLKTGIADELKMYYNGRGCYFQSASPQKGGVWAEPPKGYNKLSDHDFTFTTRDILKSSVDAYKAHGFAADVSKDTKFYESVVSKQSADDFVAAFSIAGLFNLPICELDKHFNSAKKFAVHVHPKGEVDYPMWCSCFSDKDANGKQISEFIPISKEYKKYCRDPKGEPNVGPIGV